MASTWAFKITASLIKPTRETLLDYCSYILLIISVIGISRVIIGNHELKYDCLNSTKTSLKQSENVTDNMDKTMTVEVKENYCLKYFQAYFPYILIVESTISLLIGILWVKMPKVQSLVQAFSALVHESRKSNCFRNVAGVSQSNALLAKDTVEVRILLEAMFQPSTSYSDKAKARYLYEKIQKFTFDHEHSNSLWLLYIRKSAVQFVCWFAICIINMVLFVKLEFYIGCTGELCSHDTFLRIVWFMGQILFLIYGMLNCSTLKWINNKSVAEGKSAFCKFFCGASSATPSSFSVRPYSIGRHQRLLHNDMALLLYLVCSSNLKTLPYFTVFLYDEWGAKFASPTPGLDAPIRVITREDSRTTAVFGARSAESSDADEYFPITRHAV